MLAEVRWPVNWPPTGKQILILERGDSLPKEVENWNPREVYTVGRYRPKENWLDRDGKAFAPFTHYCVGGNTKVYGAALLRLRESDFTEVKYTDGISPAWELGYDSFEPYYTEAEKLYSAHGTRGADPTEPRAGEPYPFPPVKPEPDMQELFEHIEMLGHRPAPIPIGVRLPEDHRKLSDASTLSLFGDDPMTSVLDLNCKAHDLDNLYVVDTSFFPSSGAVNPSLTAMANALRVSDHLIEKMGWKMERKMEMVL